METRKQQGAQSILFVVLGETEQQLKLARGILTDTEMCACICTKMDTAEQALTAAMSRYSALNMVVIAAPEDGDMLTNVLSMAKRAKDRGLLSVVAAQSDGRSADECFSELSLPTNRLMTCTDCVLLTPVWREHAESETAGAEGFYRDIKTFLQFMNTVVEGDGFICLDFEDISNILKESGVAYLGAGSISGTNPPERLEILPRQILEKSQGVIMHIAISEDMGLDDVEAAAELIRSNLASDAVMVFDAGFDRRLRHEIRIDVLAAGSGRRRHGMIPGINM